MYISIIIPAFNEEKNVAPLVEQIAAALKPVTEEYELVFIDDGSTDGTFDEIGKLHRADGRVKALRFRGNFGKSAALAAGFKEAGGELIFTMDADLQDDPREIPRFIEKIGEGFDLVSGWKKIRNDPLSKTAPSKVFNWFTRTLTGVNLHDFNCGFKCYRRQVVESINVYGDMHRFLPALAAEYRFRVGEIPVTHHPRRAGKSKFGVERFTRGAADLITVLFLTRYFRRPAHLFGVGGFLSVGSGFTILSYLSILWFLGERPIGNRPLLTLGVLLMVIGIQFISIGLLGEMMVRLSVGPRPDYSVIERLE